MSNYLNSIRIEGDTISYTLGMPNLYVNAKGNLCLETSAEMGNTSKGKLNLESMNDIQIKPGDDLALITSHRPTGKKDKFHVSVMDDRDINVDLNIDCANIEFSTNSKLQDYGKEDEFNIKFKPTAKSSKKRADLKLRAANIDLRSEDKGDISLQPKGYDELGHLNKVKFEHGGSDGVEFFSMDPEVMSAYVTNEYRFNKNAAIKLTSRNLLTRSGETGTAADGSSYYLDSKYDPTDVTTLTYYAKATDGFYDIIDNAIPLVTWSNIVDSTYFVNTKKDQIEYVLSYGGGSSEGGSLTAQQNEDLTWVNTNKESLNTLINGGALTDTQKETLSTAYSAFNIVKFNSTNKKNSVISNVGLKNTNNTAAKLQIESDGDIEITGNNVGANQLGNIEEGTLNLVKNVKITNKGNIKGDANVGVKVTNNATTDKEYKGVTIPAGESKMVKSVALEDIIDTVAQVKELTALVNILKAGHTITNTYSFKNAVIDGVDIVPRNGGEVDIKYTIVKSYVIDNKPTTETVDIPCTYTYTFNENEGTEVKNVSFSFTDTTYNVEVSGTAEQEANVQTVFGMPEDGGYVIYSIKYDSKATGNAGLTEEQISGAAEKYDGIKAGDTLYDIDYYYVSESGVSLKVDNIGTHYDGITFDTAFTELNAAKAGDMPAWTGTEDKPDFKFVKINNKGNRLRFKTPNTLAVYSVTIKGISNKNKNSGWIISPNAIITSGEEQFDVATFNANKISEYTFTAKKLGEDIILICGNGNDDDKAAKAVWANITLKVVYGDYVDNSDHTTNLVGYEIGAVEGLSTEVPEISGLAIKGDDVYAVSDDNTHGYAGIYKLGTDGKGTKITALDKDCEGITFDDNGDAWICAEGKTDKEKQIYNNQIYNVNTKEIVPFTDGTNTTDFGLEGIAYITGTSYMFVGNQKEPVRVYLYDTDSKEIIKYWDLDGTSEIADLEWVADHNELWVLNSKTAFIYIYKYDATTKELTFDAAKSIKLPTVVSDIKETDENPEGLCVKGNDLYVSVELGSKLYKYDLTEFNELAYKA